MDTPKYEDIYPLILERCEGLQRDLAAELAEMTALVNKKGEFTEAEAKRGIELDQILRDAIHKRLQATFGNMPTIIIGMPMPHSTGSQSTENDRPPVETIDRIAGLENIYVEGTSKALATARLFFTPWSGGFAHGPDTLLPIGRLAEKILKPGEKLRTLKRISWRSVLTHDLDLAVFDGEFQPPASSEYAVDGIFITDQGRKLSFFGKKRPADAITSTHSINPVARSMICPCARYGIKKSPEGTYSAQLRPSAENELYEVSAGIKFATLAEIVTTIISQVGADIGRADALKLMAGINDLTLPDSLNDLAADDKPLRLRILHGQERKGKSGLNIVPFEYMFPHQSSPSTGITALTESPSLASKHCGEKK